MKNMLYLIKNATHSQMQSLIATDESGKLIVVDGGRTGDAVYLLEKLKEISGQEVPHIDAWIFTHCHNDHLDAFYELLEHHPDAVEFDAVYCTFPSPQYLVEEGDNADKTMETFLRLLPTFADKWHPVSAGDTYTFGTIKIEYLLDIDTSISENKANNSSNVFRMTLGQKTILFLGDLGIEGGRSLLARYGKSLKSDLCQMAHHGQNGVEREVYEAIAPEACLWCAPDWLYNNDRGKGFNTHIYQTVTVRGWMEELGVKTHYVIKDGDQIIKL